MPNFESTHTSTRHRALLEHLGDVMRQVNIGRLASLLGMAWGTMLAATAQAEVHMQQILRAEHAWIEAALCPAGAGASGGNRPLHDHATHGVEPFQVFDNLHCADMDNIATVWPGRRSARRQRYRTRTVACSTAIRLRSARLPFASWRQRIVRIGALMSVANSVVPR